MKKKKKKKKSLIEVAESAMKADSSFTSSSSSSASSYITIEEWNGSSSSKLFKTAILTANASSFNLQRSSSRLTQVWGRIFDAFVPEGFPGSVTPDYVPFQVWDSLQGLSTYIRSMLSTQALLSAIGAGEKSATVIGATFQWFLRDVTGMLGGVLFTFYQAACQAGVASGATRAALTQHFSLANNAADISAKQITRLFGVFH